MRLLDVNVLVYAAIKSSPQHETFDLDAAGGVTNGVKFVWDAAKDLPAGFKAGGVKVKVTVK